MRMPCYSNKDKDKVLQICQIYQFRSLSLVRLLSMRMPRSSSFSVRDILDLPSLPKETDRNGNLTGTVHSFRCSFQLTIC